MIDEATKSEIRNSIVRANLALHQGRIVDLYQHLKSAEVAMTPALGQKINSAPPMTAPIEERADWWRERGENGMSSLTIWCAFTNTARSPYRQFIWPWDPDEFLQCKALMDLIPEWRSSLGTVTERFPWFQPFEEAWSELEALAPAELYDRIEMICKQAAELRWGKWLRSEQPQKASPSALALDRATHVHNSGNGGDDGE